MGVVFLGYPCGHEVQQVLLDFGFRSVWIRARVGSGRCGRGGGVPLVHAVEQFVALMDDVNVRLRQYVQIGVGNDHGDFDNAVVFRVEAGHFHIEPAEIVCVLGHFRRPCVSVGSIIKDKGSGHLKAFCNKLCNLLI